MEEITIILQKFLHVSLIATNSYLCYQQHDGPLYYACLFCSLFSFLSIKMMVKISQNRSFRKYVDPLLSIAWGISLFYFREMTYIIRILLTIVYAIYNFVVLCLIEEEFTENPKHKRILDAFIFIFIAVVIILDRMNVLGLVIISIGTFKFFMVPKMEEEISENKKDDKKHCESLISMFKISMLDENITIVLLFWLLSAICILERISISYFQNKLCEIDYVIGLGFVNLFNVFLNKFNKNMGYFLLFGLFWLKFNNNIVLRHICVGLLINVLFLLKNNVKNLFKDNLPKRYKKDMIIKLEIISMITIPFFLTLIHSFGFIFMILLAILIIVLSNIVVQYIKQRIQILETPYAKNLDKETHWNEYPRPQLKRNSFFNLNGLWDYKITECKEIPKNNEYDGNILVPFPVESLLSGVQKSLSKSEYLFYKRTFKLPNEFLNGNVILHFGAVDCIATIYLNNNEIFTHVGGYIPFNVDITKYLNKTENTLIVRVEDPLEHRNPYGKQRKDRGGMWYTPVSGIWQTVWIECVPNNFIENIKITPDIDNKQVHIKVIGSSDLEKTIQIFNDKNKIVEKTFKDDEITIEFKEIHLWSPSDPFLYNFNIITSNDSVKSYFAMRKFSYNKNQLLLNNKPFFFNGLLDQGYYSDGIYTPATLEAYKDDIIKMKEFGFNTLRKHIKIEPLLFYYLCDKIGMIVFQDFVNNSNYSFIRDTALPTIGFKNFDDTKRWIPQENKDIFIKTMEETVSLLYNTPSIGYWTIFNEGWGQFESSKAYEHLLSIDSTRIIDSHSGWFNGGKTDVSSLHIYFKPLFIEETDKPIIISEFGGYSYKIQDHSFNLDNNYGYRIYNDQESFQNGFIDLYKNEVIPLFKKGLYGCIYTQVSDVEDETNGILTYDRKVCKLDKDIISKLFEELKFEE